MQTLIAKIPFMRFFKLEKTTRILGRDYFGRKSFIIFTPTRSPGWYWGMPNGNTMEIQPTMLQHNPRRLALVHDKAKIEFFEHIGALRFIGLSGVMMESSPWPPYFGRTHELWEALKPNCVESGESIRWVTPQTSATWSYAQTYHDLQSRFTEITPSEEKKLRITITIDYPRLGEYEKTYTIPDIELLEEIFQAHSQGWPSWPHKPSKLFAAVPFRPSHECITWPQEYPRRKALRLFAEHRLLDLLGALSVLLPPHGMLAGNIRSMCSGHKADYEVVQHIHTKGGLVPLQ